MTGRGGRYFNNVKNIVFANVFLNTNRSLVILPFHHPVPSTLLSTVEYLSLFILLMFSCQVHPYQSYFLFFSADAGSAEPELVDVCDQLSVKCPIPKL